jgi:hypothetical protein
VSLNDDPAAAYNLSRGPEIKAKREILNTFSVILAMKSSQKESANVPLLEAISTSPSEYQLKNLTISSVGARSFALTSHKTPAQKGWSEELTKACRRGGPGGFQKHSQAALGGTPL